MQNFSYGTKRVKYNTNNIYVDPVDNLHDLTIFEDRLTKNGVPWAVYVKITRIDSKKSDTKFVLIAEEEYARH